jgi:tetratricopeptide (TPR) repeat protein
VLNGCEFFNSTKSATEELQTTITKYKNAVAANPQDATAWTKLGDNYVFYANQQEQGSSAQSNAWRQAVAAYKKADEVLAKQKKGPEVKKQRLAVLQSLISTYLYLTDYKAATTAYGEITELTPKEPQSYFDMATVAINAGDTNTALLAFSKFLELDPTSPDAAQVKAWIKENTPKSTPTPSPSPTK